MDGAARYKIEPDDHFDQSYNRQNRVGPLILVQCVLIREVILRKLQTFFSGLLCITGLCIGLPMVTYSGEYVLQMFDSFAGNLPLLLIAICECVGVCYYYGIKR